MLPAAVHLASLASLWAAWQGTLGVSANSRGGARSAAGEMGQTSVGYDVDGGVGLGLMVGEGRFNVTLGYSPQLTLRDVSGKDRSTLVMHNGWLNLGYAGQGWSTFVSQSVSVGTTSFRGLRTTPVNPMAMPNPTMSRVDLVPAAETAKVFNESTRAGFNYSWDPRLSSGLGAGYSISGGAGGTAQAVYPQFRTASADLSSRYTMTSRDSFGADSSLSRITTHGGATRVAGGALMMSPDFLYWTLTGGLNWNHRFSTTTGGSLGLGAFGYSTTIPGRTTLYSLAITAGGSLDTELARAAGWVVTAGVGAGASPTVNQLDGTMQQRVQSTGRISASMAKFSVTASGDATQSFPIHDPNSVRLLSAGVSVGYQPAQLVDLSAEYRSTWQTAGSNSIPRLWVVFVGIAVRAPPLRF